MFHLEEVEDQSISNLSKEDEAKLAEVYRNCTFTECNFQGVDLSKIRFSECKFADCNLSLSLVEGSSFSFCQFENCKMLAINWEKVEQVRECAFQQSSLKGSLFQDLDLSHIKISECDLTDTQFDRVNLSHGELTQCSLFGSFFEDCDLRYCDFRGSKDYEISLQRNRVEHAHFSLPDALNLLADFKVHIY